MRLYGLRAVKVQRFRLSEQQRRAIAVALAIDREAEAAALEEVEGLATIYKSDLAAGWNEREEPRRQQMNELDAVRVAAEGLGAALASLCPAAEGRLATMLGASVDGPPASEPPTWVLDAAGNVGDVAQAAAAVGYIADRAARARQQLEVELPPPAGRPKNRAVHAFGNDLAHLWMKVTKKPLPRSGSDLRSPWGRFVAAVLAAVDPTVNAERLARDVARHIHAKQTSRADSDKTRRNRRRTARVLPAPRS
jgi:hypothetical protein